MTKHIVISFIFLLGLGTWAMGESAVGGPITPYPYAPLGTYKVDISLTQWQTQGDFIMHGGPPTASNTWELKHPVDSNLTIVRLRLTNKHPAFPPVWFDLAFGGGNIQKGIIKDTDWDTGGNLWHLSRSSSQGITKHISFQLGYPLVQSGPGETKEDVITKRTYRLDLVLGTRYLKNSVDYSDPTKLVDNYVVTNTSWSERWLEYELTYQGLEIGLAGQMDLGKIDLEVQFGYVPNLKADYKGTRYPQRPAGPNFWNQHRERITADGTALSAEIMARIDLSKKLSINLGYKYLKYETEGKDTSDGYWKWIGSREELDTYFKGFFFGADLRF